ncbi:MAG: hypothetical protein QMD92_00445 [bacterium]|nr:hypothetical protein [bacterium]
MKKHDIWFVLKSFVIWRIAITLIAVLAIRYLPLFSQNFFGGKYVNYITNPLFWGWANFDGEHYLSIAMFGYKNLQQFYFPVYPFLIKVFTYFIGIGLSSYLWIGILISNTSLFIALLGFYKLALFDYSEKISKLAVILLLLFPTSFYFGAVYTESLFLCLTVWSFYFFRKQKYFWVAILGMFASATRIVGIILLPVFLFHLILNKKPIKKERLSLFLMPLGLFGFMYYTYVSWGGFLKFFQTASIFGEQRSKTLIMLPQVFYRYFVKILPNLSWGYFPVVFTTLLEISVAVLFLYLIVISFKKIRWDYWLFSVLGYLIPSLSGSFSSLPRYVLVLFPLFLFVSQKLINTKKPLLIGIFVILTIIAVIAQSFFIRGYFVS